MAETILDEISTEPENLIGRTVEIVAAYVTRNSINPGELAKILGDVHRALRSLGSTSGEAVPDPTLTPAIPIKKSVTPDFIICLDDGKQFKSLKRHLTALGMTPDEYRTKWGLRSDYPMVAPNYSATRSGLAKSSGLGRTAADPSKQKSAAKTK